jgi:hypothetical protein
MVGGAASAFISRRLQAAQPRTLHEHGVDPSGISVGCAVAVGRHRRIFRHISRSSTTRQIFGFSLSPAWYRKFRSDGTAAMICYWRGAQ